MIRLVAHAKINLFLEITGKRKDGYHLLSTLFQTISLGDELSFAPHLELTLTCSDSSLPVDERNLVMRAALGLQEALGETRGARIHLKKIVPMGAGLGGGSADAAATLRGLLKLWKRRLSKEKLHQLAVSLGADVPFFLQGGLCEGSGIGDELKPLKPFAKQWMVIVWPGFGISTKEAYAKVQLPFKDPRTLKGSYDLRSEFFFNRFESLVFSDHPQLPRLKKQFSDLGATAVLMSGSGSAVYGLARSRGAAREIFNSLKTSYPDCWLAHTK